MEKDWSDILGDKLKDAREPLPEGDWELLEKKYLTRRRIQTVWSWASAVAVAAVVLLFFFTIRVEKGEIAADRFVAKAEIGVKKVWVVEPAEVPRKLARLENVSRRAMVVSENKESVKNMGEEVKSIQEIPVQMVETKPLDDEVKGKEVQADEEVDLKVLGYFVINGILLLFANPLIFIIERIFGYISDASLLELANTNNTLLRQFSEVAPGSFQHSMQVSNLAAECAVALNGKANPILVRTAALYHDIGKMNNPEFFTENQTGGRSPHEGRPEDESAEIIKNHVSDGLKIAKQHNLPEKIQDFIASHHGESKAMYFYVNFVKNHPEAVVDEAKFTYPGPRPSSREMCILSMCDAVEAASRSMKDYNDQSINDLVENIISTQVRDGMFDLAPITFDQIKIIKAVLKSKLKTIYHTRISYPELKK